jgi:hypothetical protein
MLTQCSQHMRVMVTATSKAEDAQSKTFTVCIYFTTSSSTVRRYSYSYSKIELFQTLHS